VREKSVDESQHLVLTVASLLFASAAASAAASLERAEREDGEWCSMVVDERVNLLRILSFFIQIAGSGS
jgi:hypothetical protein